MRNATAPPDYLDFLGVDGSAAGVVDAAAPIGTVVTCEACHNNVTLTKDSVVFPSGVEVTGLGREARCMECHQGRESTVSVNADIVEVGLEGPENLDVISEDLGFSNIHYYAAAATQYGTIVMGGYEYDGNTYDSQFEHVEGFNTCEGCHDPHTLEVKFDDCTECHTDLRDAEDLLDIRMAGSLVDYDGDGDQEEGVYYEIEGLREILYASLQMYAGEVVGVPLVYDSHAYPYFFIDDGNGEVDEGEANFGNRYLPWTPRLTQAAYNYQVSLKDPGRYAHGGKYIIQLLYDSIDDLNAAISAPVDMAALHRIDHGHFAGSEEAFRHWDEDGFVVSASCSKCHSADGLPLFAAEGVTISQPAANGFRCDTCHTDLQEYTLLEIESATFPSGASVSFEDPSNNLCITCHQGRESTVSVNNAIGDLGDDEVGDGLRFRNIHYFVAGATLFGTEVKGAYEFDGQTYVGRNEHVAGFDSCTECHNTHALEVEVAECADCHEGVETAADLLNIRNPDVLVDYDGDGDGEEGIAMEVSTMHDALYVALQDYAANTVGSGVLYVSTSYPYFFNDTNGNGEADADEVSRDNAFGSFTPTLLRAAYNYQYAAKDPGAFAHNGQYVLQILYDSLNEVGGDTSAMTRP